MYSTRHLLCIKTPLKHMGFWCTINDAYCILCFTCLCATCIVWNVCTCTRVQFLVRCLFGDRVVCWCIAITDSNLSALVIHYMYVYMYRVYGLDNSGGIGVLAQMKCMAELVWEKQHWRPNVTIVIMRSRQVSFVCFSVDSAPLVVISFCRFIPHPQFIWIQTHM